MASTRAADGAAAPRRLAVDFGAGFADFLSGSPSGHRFLKIQRRDTLWDSLQDGLQALSLDLDTLDELRIAATAPLNALLDRKTARVALLTTAGFGDTLSLGRQNRRDIYDPVARSPAPVFLADREDIHEVSARLDASGSELAPVDEDQLSAVLDRLAARQVQAIAVCFLFAHVNPEHEHRAAARIAARFPDVPLSLSHRVDGQPREYERTVATVFDAWLRAGAAHEIIGLQDRLAEHGFQGSLLFGDGRGVVVSAAQATETPAATLPAAPAAAARTAAGIAPEGACLALDIGSRSADICLADTGHPALVDPGDIGGVTFRREMIDLESYAIGGRRPARQDGTRIAFDAAEPDAPTLDDALALLNRLPVPRDGAAARLAALSGGDAQTTAQAIVIAAEGELAACLTRFATRRNVDPTRATLVVSGGTGGLLAAGIAQALGLSQVCLPRAPAASGALGLAQAPRRWQATATFDCALSALTPDRLHQTIDRLCADVLHHSGEGAATRLVLTLAARRPMHPFTFALEQRPGSADDIARAFAAAYTRAYGITPPGEGHLFRISVQADRVGSGQSLPSEPARLQPASDQGALYKAEAGHVWVPPRWQLTRTARGLLLQAVPA